MSEQGTVTAESYPEFNRLYKKALKQGKGSFIFQGAEVLTTYVKYLCEYVETQRGGRP